MSVLSDKQIAHLCQTQSMISPFLTESIKEIDGVKIISKGLSSYGYDVTLSDELYYVTKAGHKGAYENEDTFIIRTHLDPKDPKRTEEMLRRLFPIKDRHTGEEMITIPPHGFVLAHTVETINIPNDVLVHVTGKSTYARAGLSVTVTPIEPGFSGQAVLELFNSTPRPLRIYPGEGICQFVFMLGDEPYVVK